MKVLASLALVPLLVSGCSSTPPRPDKAGGAPFEVQLLAVNDFHGAIEPPSGSNGEVTTARGKVPAGGVAYLATWLNALRASHGRTVVVSAGDNIGATPLISGAFHDEPTIEALSQAGLMVSSVGNHEFDEGYEELLRMQRGGCHPKEGCFGETPFKGASFQYLAANVRRDDTGETVFPGYVIREFGGVPVAFIGMTLEGTPAILSGIGKRGLSFQDEVDTVNRLVPELRAQGIEAIVVLVHEGGLITGLYDGCDGISGPIVAIVKGFDPAVDVVVTGHTHRAYLCELSGRLVTSAMSNGRLITDIRLTLDPKSRDIVKRHAENVIVTREVTPEPGLQALVTRWKALIGPVERRVVGTISHDFTRKSNDFGESTLGNLVADAQLFAERDRSTGRAELALMNPGGVRADLLVEQTLGGEAPGEVTYGEVFTVQPFMNPLVTMTLTGAEILGILEQEFATNKAPPRVLFVSSNVRVGVNLRASKGNRIQARDVTVSGRVLDLKRDYRVVVNQFLAEGGDGLEVLKRGRERIIGVTDVDALANYLTQHPNLRPLPLGQRFVKSGR